MNAKIDPPIQMEFVGVYLAEPMFRVNGYLVHRLDNEAVAKLSDSGKCRHVGYNNAAERFEHTPAGEPDLFSDSLRATDWGLMEWRDCVWVCETDRGELTGWHFTAPAILSYLATLPKKPSK